jgi:antibiotic biosynthesis monooxygenase
VFAVHASKQDPREFWLYETWTDAQAVEAHESGPAFKAYKDDLRPLVDPDSLVFGDAEPLAVRGYRGLARGSADHVNHRRARTGEARAGVHPLGAVVARRQEAQLGPVGQGVGGRRRGERGGDPAPAEALAHGRSPRAR